MAGQSAVFFFPRASGHVNPSLPIAKRLVTLGWRVLFICGTQFQEAIEGTGATFVDVLGLVRDFYHYEDVDAEMKSWMDYGAEGPQAQCFIVCGSGPTMRYLPLLIKYLRDQSASLVLYCPVFCFALCLAARHVGIPAVSLLTVPGPGYWYEALLPLAAAAGKPAEALIEDMRQTVEQNAVNAEAIATIQRESGLPGLTLNTTFPLFRDQYSTINLVTTTSDMQDRQPEGDKEWYEEAGKRFVFVGPLLEEGGAERAGQHLSGGNTADGTADDDELRKPLSLDELAAHEGGFVYVSMGTVITGDTQFGWDGKCGTAVTGGQLCRAVYKGVFDALGNTSLRIVVSVGGRPDAIDGVVVPANVTCRRTVPQVELLRLRPKLFVTNCGANSFMESLSAGVPMVACPGFGDQPTQGRKVEAIAVGRCVPRPVNEEAVTDFPAKVAQAVKDVLGAVDTFEVNARRVQDTLASAGGVEEAVRVLLAAVG